MKVAIIGTQGIPAQYGGFETLAENLVGEHCSKDIEYTVFCSSKDFAKRMERHKNARLEYIPFKANGAQSIIYDLISLWRVRKGYDVVLYLGPSVPIMKLYKKMCKAPLVINIDGLDQLRDKYGKLEKKYLTFVKDNEIRRADLIVADNVGIQEYVEQNYGLDSRLIAYGGDQVLVNDIPEQERDEILKRYGVKRGEYGIAVCRIEPENNCDIVVEAFAKSGKPLLYIGNWDRSEYGRQLRERYAGYPNLILHDPEYDLRTLCVLRGNAEMYVHGHRVGGTNPSLVEAMFFGRPIVSYDVNYNRHTTCNHAQYFSSAAELEKILTDGALPTGEQLLADAREHYTWRHIVEQYEQAYRDVLSRK